MKNPFFLSFSFLLSFTPNTCPNEEKLESLMASHHRSGSRHRSPSPGSSSKRSRHSYRERSRSRDRHRSSSHRHHRSSRYDDRSYHSSSSRHHYDNVSVNDKRTLSREPTSRNEAVGTTSAPSSQETKLVSLFLFCHNFCLQIK